MTKYYISADLEGVTGVSSILQCYPKSDLTGYHAAVNQLALEINTVTETIWELDPTAEIVVNDAHSTMTNLRPEHLSPKVRLLSGKPKICAMMSGLDRSVDVALLIGYHAKAGTDKGVLNHTFHDKLFDVRINGVACGEGAVNALYASLVHQVPIILASGDKAFCQEIKASLPTLFTVETKQGISTTAALSHPVDSVLEAYRQETRKAVQNQAAWGQNLLRLEAPYTLQVTFINSLACDVVMTSPLYKRIDGRTVEMTSHNFQVIYQGLQAAYTMLAYTNTLE